MFVFGCGLFGCVPLTFQMNGDVRSMHLITHVHEKNSYASCLYPFRVTCVYVKRWVYKQYFSFLFHRKLQFVYLYILKWNLYGYNNTEQRIVSEKYFCYYFNSLVRKMHRVDGIIKQMNLIIHVPFLWSLVTVLHNTCDCKCSQAILLRSAHACFAIFHTTLALIFICYRHICYCRWNPMFQNISHCRYTAQTHELFSPVGPIPFNFHHIPHRKTFQTNKYKS
jgi:hypothetical protein